MDIQKLQFFDNSGYNLNFEWNETNGYWEGNIYLPRVSVGIYANTSIYILEETTGGHSNVFTNTFSFPMGPGKIVFNWDKTNKFVDEFFMFNFDENYIIKETSALVYTPNDGPDCNTLLINRFDEYEIPLNDEFDPRALPVHIAFMAYEKYDATTYNRTLIMSYVHTVNGKKKTETVAKIKFYAETVEEDERLKIWNANLGYNITPEDTMIFYKSDIKEYMPDYKLLNEKRKELMMEGSNIYPYIGSYKAIINAIKFFGYENLYIIEYWRNVNPEDENFGKIYHSSKYSLKKRETLRVGARNIVLPNKDYKKMNALALVYLINEPTGEVDEWELPYVKEKFTYTIEEALVKLFALRKKLNKEFMPGSSRIIDIIGEANYFGIQGIKKINDSSALGITDNQLRIDFDVYPSKYLHITDNEYFRRYIEIKKNNDSTDEVPLTSRMLSDMFSVNISDISGQRASSIVNPNNLKDPTTFNEDNFKGIDYLFGGSAGEKNQKKCEFYKNYYRDVFEDQVVHKAIEDNDNYPYVSSEYSYDDLTYKTFSAKVVLRNKTFSDVTFDDCELKFNCKHSNWVRGNENDQSIPAYTYDNETSTVSSYNGGKKLEIDKSEYEGITFNNIDSYARPNIISWTITMSKPDFIENGIGYQIDEELKNVGVYKTYEYHDWANEPYSITTNTFSGNKNIDEYNEFFAELPYIGYYDVTVEIGYGNIALMESKQTRTRKKCIKVEPYNIELIGFYYDARELPEKLKYENDEDSAMYKFIQENIENMYGWAVSERNSLNIPVDQSVPFYTAEGQMVGVGPYFNKNVEDEWYLADNLTYEMGLLNPLISYTRYIRSGVDVKPYTWFLLGYEYSKIAGKINPHWSITNETTNTTQEWDGRYLTLLLKKEGNYKVTLTLEDKNGNKYEITRNIIVVSKDANYKLYQTFKKDYDRMTEEELLREAREFYETDKADVDENPNTEAIDINVSIHGMVSEYPKHKDVVIRGIVEEYPKHKDVNIDGDVILVKEDKNVNVYGKVREYPQNKDVRIYGKVRLISEEQDVTIDGTTRFEQDEYDVTIDGSVKYEQDPDVTINIDIEGTLYNNTHEEDVTIDGIVNETTPVYVDGILETEYQNISVDIEGLLERKEENIPVNIEGEIDSSTDEVVPITINGSVEPSTDPITVNIEGLLDPDED